MSRPSTKGFFVPERLFDARKARGMTQKDVAELVGCEASAISKWENGQAAPEPATLTPLANSLGVYPTFFSKSLPESRTIFWRSFANAAKRARNREEARLRWVQDISLSVQQYLELPEVDIPNFINGRHYTVLSYDDLEAIAIEMRSHWGLGESPIDNVVLLAENAGVVIGLDYALSNSIDGQSTWSSDDDRPYMLLSKDKDNAYRRAMDCAHELSHLVLHKSVTEQELEDDFDIIEDQAKYLAGALMLPYSSFTNEIRSLSLDGFLELKPRWMVSVAAMIMRAKQTDIIGAEAATRLWKYRAARGWHRKEPLDDPRETAVPNPRLLRRSIDLIVTHKIRSKRDILEQDFCVMGEDVETLCSLPVGYFDEPAAQIVPLQPRLKEPTAENGSGDVIQFRRP